MLDTGQQLPASFMDNWLIQLIHVTSTFKTCFQVFWESLDELVLMIFFIYTKTLNNELLDDLGMWKYFCSSLLTFEKKNFFLQQIVDEKKHMFQKHIIPLVLLSTVLESHLYQVWFASHVSYFLHIFQLLKSGWH